MRRRRPKPDYTKIQQLERELFPGLHRRYRVYLSPDRYVIYSDAAAAFRHAAKAHARVVVE